MTGGKSPEFLARREEAKLKINRLDADVVHDNPEREAFFNEVYVRADGDAAAIPWADLEAKDRLVQWLAFGNEPKGRAIDIGCGLGDNAEALAKAGYETVAFDLSQEAIDWAKSRFPENKVDYKSANLFHLPKEWLSSFALVHECYTLQAMPPETLEKTIPAIASLVAPGGLLLVYTRVREDGSEVNGPPWPLESGIAMSFDRFGLELVSCETFELKRPGRVIPHIFCIWRMPQCG